LSTTRRVKICGIASVAEARLAHDAGAARRPSGLDLCTGVRTGSQLDATKLAAFMAAVSATR
jgi:phosphoribosylanthranilate isomerase